jgi:HK97 gp10 family phage protein
MTVNFNGLAALAKAFTPAKVKKIVVEEMQVMSDRAKEINRYINPAYDTGALNNSIRIQLLITDDPDKIVVALMAGGGIVYYGPYIEFGLAGRAARPFLRPAWDELSDSVKKAIVTRLRELVKRESIRSQIK